MAFVELEIEALLLPISAPAFVHVAVIPKEVGSGDLMQRITSPGAVAAETKLDAFFRLVAKESPAPALAFASVPLIGSQYQIVMASPYVKRFKLA